MLCALLGSFRVCLSCSICCPVLPQKVPCWCHRSCFPCRCPCCWWRDCFPLGRHHLWKHKTEEITLTCHPWQPKQNMGCGSTAIKLSRVHTLRMTQVLSNHFEVIFSVDHFLIKAAQCTFRLKHVLEVLSSSKCSQVLWSLRLREVSVWICSG